MGIIIYVGMPVSALLRFAQIILPFIMGFLLAMLLRSISLLVPLILMHSFCSKLIMSWEFSIICIIMYRYMQMSALRRVCSGIDKFTIMGLLQLHGWAYWSGPYAGFLKGWLHSYQMHTYVQNAASAMLCCIHIAINLIPACWLTPRSHRQYSSPSLIPVLVLA